MLCDRGDWSILSSRDRFVPQSLLWQAYAAKSWRLTEGCPGFWHIAISVQMDFLVFDGSP